MQVRACLFLYAGYRFFLEEESEIHPTTGTVPIDGYAHLLQRRFEDAINTFRKALDSPVTPRSTARFNKLASKEKREEIDGGNIGPNGNLCSAFAEVYRNLAFDKLSVQVSSPGINEPLHANTNQRICRLGQVYEQAPATNGCSKFTIQKITRSASIRPS